MSQTTFRLLCIAALSFALVSAASAANYTVNVWANSFQPGTLEIQTGDTVTFVNRADEMHTITSDSSPPAWGEEWLMDEDETVTFQFNTPGTYAYRCRLHVGMAGTIIVSAGGGGNQPPTVEVTAPQDGRTYASDSEIVLQADAADSDGFVASVEFFANWQSLGTVTAPPFTLAMSNPPPGVYEVAAIATDNEGETAISLSVTITVVEAVPIVLSAPRWVGGLFQFDFTANAGLTYEVEGSEQPDSQTMISLRTEVAADSVVTFTDDNPGILRFFRVKRVLLP